MLTRKKSHCLLTPDDIKPTRDDLEVVGAFNPGVIQTDDGVVIMARVAERPRHRTEDHFTIFGYDLTKTNADGITMDRVPADQIHEVDPRVYELPNGTTRLNFISTLRVYHSADGKTIDRAGPTLFPTNDYETFGIEDPRITRIGDTYYITYVAVSPFGVCTAIMTTTDFETFDRHEPCFVPENKDVVLFPEKFDGQFMCMHRPNPNTKFCMPEMWLAQSNDLNHWGDHQRFFGGADFPWSTGRIGAGAPPFRTDQGWVELYHGNDKTAGSDESHVGMYVGALILLDHDNPAKIIGYSDGPIMKPEADFERQGFVNDVVFPTAVLERDDELWVYYGAADDKIGLAIYDRDVFLKSIRRL